MKPRSTLVLVVLALAVGAFIVFYERHLPPPGVPTGPGRILPNIEPTTVTSVQVRPGGTLEIRAERTNSFWVLTKPISQPAEGLAIEALLQALSELRGDARIEPPGSGSTNEFGLDPPFSTVILQHGGRVTQIHIGRPTPLRDQVFLQVVGLEGIYLADARLLKLLPPSPSAWRSPQLLSTRDQNFDRVVVTNATRLVELEREPATKLWRMVRPMTARADNPRVEALLQGLFALRATAFIGDEAQAELEALGFQPPTLEIVLAQGTNPVATLQFGKALTNDASSCFARRVSPPGLFVVPQETIAPWRAAHTEFRERRLVSLAADIVDEIEFRGTESFVVRRLTNDVWQVAGTNGFAADPALVFDLLGTLSSLEAAQFVKDVVTPLDLPSYGLAPPLQQIFLRTASTNAPGIGTNRVVAELDFGTPSGEFVHARRADESSVVGVRKRDWDRVPTAAWRLRERRLWNFGINDVSRLTLRDPQRSLELSRLGTNQWSGTIGATNGVNELALDEALFRLGQLEAAAWVARGDEGKARYGLTARSATLTVELKTGRKHTLEIGGVSQQGLPFAATAIEAETWVFLLQWTVFEALHTALGASPTAP